MAINQQLGYLLLAVLAFPLVAAAIIGFGTRTSTKAARGMSVYFSLIQLLLTITLAVMTFGFSGQLDRKLGWNPKIVLGDAGQKGDESAFSGRTAWNLLTLVPEAELSVLRNKHVPDPAIQFFIGVDSINIFLVSLTSLIFFLSTIVSWGEVKERAGSFYGWIFFLQFAITGAFVAFDLILFYMFFELTLIPSFFLIGQFGTGSARRDAARKFVLYTLFGSLLTLVGIIGIVLTNPTAMHPKDYHAIFYPPEQATLSGENDSRVVPPKAGTITFSIPYLIRNVNIWDSHAFNAVAHAQRRLATEKAHEKNLRQEDLTQAEEQLRTRRNTQFWLFLALIAGFAVKIPIVPFHTWLPAAYGEAPLTVTMIFSAVMAKLGTYGILRIVIPLVPEAAVQYGLPWFGTLGAIGIVYAAFCAYAQKDLKMLAAYSSVSHLGFLVVGLFAMNPEGFSGAVLHMINHGLTAGALFAFLVFLTKRYGSLDANQYSGLWTKYPRFAFVMIVIALASVGVPGLNNFVSEMLMLAGLFDYRNLKITGYGLPVVAAVGILLSSWYTMTMIRRLLFGATQEPPTPESGQPTLTDMTGREMVPAFILVFLCFGLGLFPQPILDLMQSDIESVSAVVSNARYRLDPTAIPPDVAEMRKQREAARPPQPNAGLPEREAPQMPGPRQGRPQGPGGRPGAPAGPLPRVAPGAENPKR